MAHTQCAGFWAAHEVLCSTAAFHLPPSVEPCTLCHGRSSSVQSSQTCTVCHGPRLGAAMNAAEPPSLRLSSPAMPRPSCANNGCATEEPAALRFVHAWHQKPYLARACSNLSTHGGQHSTWHNLLGLPRAHLVGTLLHMRAKHTLQVRERMRSGMHTCPVKQARPPLSLCLEIVTCVRGATVAQPGKCSSVHTVRSVCRAAQLEGVPVTRESTSTWPQPARQPRQRPKHTGGMLRQRGKIATHGGCRNRRAQSVGLRALDNASANRVSLCGMRLWRMHTRTHAHHP